MRVGLLIFLATIVVALAALIYSGVCGCLWPLPFALFVTVAGGVTHIATEGGDDDW